LQKNRRFWSKNFLYCANIEENVTFKSLATIIASEMRKRLDSGKSSRDITEESIPYCDTGLIVAAVKGICLGSSNPISYNLVFPIHDSILQVQHSFITQLANVNDEQFSNYLDLDFNSESRSQLDSMAVLFSPNISCLICGFSPRAQHVVNAPNEEERPVDPLRLEALNAALLSSTSTTAEELLSERMAGTSPARIYRSFVSPRPNKKYLLEPVQRAADRTAAQIELALRQS
jgi:hypothetical protein